MNKTKFEKGITLIALIITIIVLLIIAIVTIGAVQKSSIITHAQNAASDYRGKQDEEKANIIIAEELMDEYAGSEEKLTPTDQKYLLFTHDETKLTSTFIGMNPEYKRADGTYGDGNYVITDLVIPTVVKNGSGKDSVVISIAGSPSQEKVSTIKTVVLPETIEMINAYSFKNWTGLTSINIPSKVKNILQCAFENCTSLTTVTIPEGFSALAFGAFSGCTSLTKAYLPSTIYMHGGDQFKGCSSDLTIYVNKYESECLSWHSSWYGNAKVIYKTKENTGTASPADQKYLMFRYEDSTSTAIFTGMNPEYKRADGTYGYGDYVITDLVIPEKVINDSGVESTVTKLDYGALSGVATIKTVVLPETLEDIDGHAFENCTGLTAVNIPSKVSRIGSFAFAGCTNLTTVTIPEGELKTMTSYDFQNCTSLTEIKIPSTITFMQALVFDGSSSNLEIYVDRYKEDCSWPPTWSGNAKVIYKTAQ